MSEILKFSQQIADMLRTAGWSETRSVDTSISKEYLEKHGFKFHPVALKVSQQLEGIELRIPEGIISLLSFKPQLAIRFLTADDLKKLETHIDAKLSPIGSGDGYIVLISEEGSIYLIDDQWLSVSKFKNLDEFLQSVTNGDLQAAEEICF